MTSPTKPTLPTDFDGLTALLGQTSVSDRWDVERRLIEQMGDEGQARSLFATAISEVLHEEGIERSRTELRVGFRQADAALDRIVGILDHLVSDEVYDVEYAEGSAGRDIRHFLGEAARNLRAAEALNPVRGTGKP